MTWLLTDLLSLAFFVVQNIRNWDLIRFVFFRQMITLHFFRIPTYQLFGRQVVLVLVLMRLLKGMILWMAERGCQWEWRIGWTKQVIPENYSEWIPLAHHKLTDFAITQIKIKSHSFSAQFSQHNGGAPEVVGVHFGSATKDQVSHLGGAFR